MSPTVTRGVYPGAFNPLTVAHLAVADVAVTHHGLGHLDLVLSRVPLGKETDAELAPVEERAARIDAVIAGRRGMGVRVTDAQLLADIAEGYDLLVVGADKWAQLHDPAFYGGDPARRDDALRRLPPLAVAPRPPHPVPDPDASRTPPIHLLPVPAWAGAVSASAVRAGRSEWLAPGADPPATTADPELRSPRRRAAGRRAR